ncbi:MULTISPECIES: hypothetical protein [Comamonadaceae]|uniref:hypothetical protein n=1 Tax=Comamonadaceae TaxID=80864 RepID=UPI00068BB34B|nr:hypothetical protein [Paracidovorax oryzae]
MALTNLTVQSDNNAGPLYQQGWDFYATDLNQGAGGKYIYVGYQRGTANPITDVRFEAYDSAQQNSIPGWEWSPVDLNEGAGGKYIYMYWKRGGAAPITNLMFLALNESTPPQIPGWTHVGPDLNEGAGGAYIWAYYSHTVQQSAAKVKVAR